MAKQRTSFAKLQRDRAKAAKKAAKQAKVQGKTDDYWGATSTSSAVPETTTVEDPSSIDELFAGKDVLNASEMMTMVEKISSMRAAGTITEEEFEDAKIEIFTRLPE